MALKGGSPDHGRLAGRQLELTGELAEVAARWEIEPERDLSQAASAA